ncbi:hypothetical protein AAFF_G00310890 [Aldrovandia affinis]|uniref:Uncharacterized protein n=1 Tax=Aldrovandia affinis TaxID=143900 RepID=A0AAD7R7L5_9TELE|nr:hypothetical protein AAFF_G00310890 [Aldrovandia affinis]
MAPAPRIALPLPEDGVRGASGRRARGYRSRDTKTVTALSAAKPGPAVLLMRLSIPLHCGLPVGPPLGGTQKDPYFMAHRARLAADRPPAAGRFCVSPLSGSSADRSLVPSAFPFRIFQRDGGMDSVPPSGRGSQGCSARLLSRADIFDRELRSWVRP